MALTVETGAVVTGADSYISQSDADTYFTEHGAPSAWTGLTSDEKDSALRYACIALEGMFNWSGEIVSLTQPRSWPRSGASDNDGRTIAADSIDQRLKDAQCELALLHTSSALNASYDRGGAVKSEQVGPIRTEYFQGASAEPSLPIISRIVGGLGILRGAMTGVLERA